MIRSASPPSTPSVTPPTPGPDRTTIIHAPREFDAPSSRESFPSPDPGDAGELKEVPPIPIDEEKGIAAGLGLDDDIDAALAVPGDAHMPDFCSKRPRSPDIQGSLVPPPDERLRRPMTSSTNGLSISTIEGSRHTKFGTGKWAGIELQPQPSDSRDDPLNWPTWRKHLNLASLLVVASIANATKTALVPVNGVVAVRYGVSYTAAASLTAVPLALASVSGLLGNTAARLWGKRPVYLASLVVLLVGTIWNAAARDRFADCMGARAFQGIGWGAFDVLLLGTLHDTYFYHERELYVGIYDVATALTTWGPPLLGGVVSRNTGTFATQFTIISVLLALALILVLLGAPETVYDRHAVSTGARIPYTPSQPVHPREMLSAESVKKYLAKVPLVAHYGDMSLKSIVQAVRACAAPTVGLVFIATFLPHSALWALVQTVSLLFSPLPFRLSPAAVGCLMTGPLVLSLMSISGVSFHLGRSRESSTPRTLLVAACAGTFLAVTGLMAYGLEIHGKLTRNPRPAWSAPDPGLNFPLLSILLGFLAAGTAMLLLVQRPLIARSLHSTCCNAVARSRVEVDMAAGTVFWRGIFAAIFVMAAPDTVGGGVGSGFSNGLRDIAVGMGIAHIAVVVGCALVWWEYEVPLRWWDGVVMGLEGGSGDLKRTGSFFDFD